ncbi:Uncharacterised protein at_DN1181 [Pycnogonum litorale]
MQRCWISEGQPIFAIKLFIFLMDDAIQDCSEVKINFSRPTLSLYGILTLETCSSSIMKRLIGISLLVSMLCAVGISINPTELASSQLLLTTSAGKSNFHP